MKKLHSKYNIFFGLIFICVMVFVSIFTIPKNAPSQQNKQTISFDFPASYANSTSCQ